MCAAILARHPTNALEIGSGSGRIYQRLRAEGFEGAYTGLEMSAEVIALDEKAFPEASWICGSIYDAPLPAVAFDTVCIHADMEHAADRLRAIRQRLGGME